jgi:hypothetical protein
LHPNGELFLVSLGGGGSTADAEFGVVEKSNADKAIPAMDLNILNFLFFICITSFYKNFLT